MTYDEAKGNSRMKAKLHAIANPTLTGRITRRDLTPKLSQILGRVSDALYIRQQENAKVGRNDAEDALLEALDLAETRLLQLGALPRIKA
jgi:hypothetical protein